MFIRFDRIHKHDRRTLHGSIGHTCIALHNNKTTKITLKNVEVKHHLLKVPVCLSC